MMDEELKPCPFCGGKAKVKATKKEHIGFTIWCACESCECGARTVGFCPDTNREDDTLENIERCKKRAIKAWNRRASNGTDYDVDKVVEQLKSESARWQDSGDAYNDEKEKGVAIGFRKAIEIVKGGGVDAKTDS